MGRHAVKRCVTTPTPSRVQIKVIYHDLTLFWLGTESQTKIHSRNNGHTVTLPKKIIGEHFVVSIHSIVCSSDLKFAAWQVGNNAFERVSYLCLLPVCG